MIFRIHVVIITTVLTQFLLIVLYSPCKVRPSLVLLILFRAAASLTFQHGLIKSAGGYLIRLYLRLLHFLVDLDKLFRLLASSARLEQPTVNKLHVPHRLYLLFNVYEKSTSKLDQLRCVCTVNGKRSAEHLVPEEEEHLDHVSGELIVVHFGEVLGSNQRAHHLLVNRVFVVVRDRARLNELVHVQDGPHLVAPCVIHVQPFLIWLHWFYWFLLGEWEYQSWVHQIPFLLQDFLKEYYLLVILRLPKCAALYEICKMSCLCEFIDEGVRFLCIFLQSKTCHVEALLRIGYIRYRFIMFTQIF